MQLSLINKLWLSSNLLLNHSCKSSKYTAGTAFVHQDLMSKWTNPVDAAEMKAISAPHAGDWLFTQPLTWFTFLSLRFSEEIFF